MNLARILDQTLPDLGPARSLENIYPRCHPRLIAREYEDREGTIVMCIIPGGKPPSYFRMSPMQYQLAQCFDGNRNYQEVSEEFFQQTGLSESVEELKEFAAALEKMEFWYKTPQEASALLCHELMTNRRRHLKKKKDLGDLASIELIHFDPNDFLTWIYKYTRWLYSNWFTAWSMFMLLVAGIILGSRWREVWADSVQFYTLTGYGFGHVVDWFAMFLLLGAVHETAHGLTCKHFGGSPHRMGAFTIYLCPSIFCDVSEIWVYGGRWERMATVLAGVWSEIVMCTYAAVIWWATPPNTWLHTASYYVILSGGVFCVLINWNPLAQMDGYYLFCELFRFPDIKAQSTEFLSAWVRHNIFRMPATVPNLPPLRRLGFAAYAVTSGVYCYSLLLFLCRVVYHILQFYTPRWAFLPATALALLIFRSRIRKLVQFMKDLYREKLPLLKTHRRLIAAMALLLAALLLAPLRRETLEQRFVLEPARHEMLRAQVPGRVLAVYAHEGDRVRAGQDLVRLSDLAVDTRLAQSAASLQKAAALATSAQLRYADFASAQQQRLRFAEDSELAAAQARRLQVVAPFPGVVVSPRPQDLAGSYAKAGAPLLEVADLTTMRARIYVAEADMRKLQSVQEAVLRPDGRWFGLRGRIASISAASEQPDKSLIPAAEYKGTTGIAFFDVQVLLDNGRGELRDGMTGTVLLYGQRRSAIAMLLQPWWDAVARRVW